MIAEERTTAQATDPETTEATRWWTRYPAKMADWTPELRSKAAREGWRRRRDPQPPDRLETLLKTTDARTLRLLACDLAQAALPRYAVCFPDDLRAAAALQVARRYATGAAGERERLAAMHLLSAVIDGYGLPEYISYHEQDYSALGAVWFALTKPADAGLRAASYWADFALYEDASFGMFGDDHNARLLAAFEARLASQNGQEIGS